MIQAIRASAPDIALILHHIYLFSFRRSSRKSNKKKDNEGKTKSGQDSHNTNETHSNTYIIGKVTNP